MTFDDYTPPDWNVWFMQGVYWVASKSKDPKTKVGAIIVKDNRIISTGYNGIPMGVNDTIQERHERPEKYKWYEHGERNAIFSAAKHGISTNGAVLYTSWLPCADCARAVIQAGIEKVVVHTQFMKIKQSVEIAQWIGHDVITKQMFVESDVILEEVNAVIGSKTYFDGKVYEV